MVFDPTASASSSQTWVAIIRRVSTFGERRSNSSTNEVSIAVSPTGSPATVTSRVAGSNRRSAHSSTGSNASGGRRCSAWMRATSSEKSNGFTK